MSFDQPPSDKMMQAAPEKKEFHFAGGGVWRNATILADTIEEAEAIWNATKKLIVFNFDLDSATPVDIQPQSTPTPEPQSEESAVQ